MAKREGLFRRPLLRSIVAPAWPAALGGIFNFVARSTSAMFRNGCGRALPGHRLPDLPNALKPIIGRHGNGSSRGSQPRPGRIVGRATMATASPFCHAQRPATALSRHRVRQAPWASSPCPWRLAARRLMPRGSVALVARPTIAAKLNAETKPALAVMAKIMPDVNVNGNPAASETSWPWSCGRPCCARHRPATWAARAPCFARGLTESRSGANPARRNSAASPAEISPRVLHEPLSIAV